MARYGESEWVWRVGGRYGYWYADKYKVGDTSYGTYGDAIGLRTKKDATAVVNALNAAFAAGQRYQRQLNPIPADFPVRPLGDRETAGNRVECGDCGRAWDDAIVTSVTPAPDGRCPFEEFH